MKQWLAGLSPILDPMAGVGRLRLPGLVYNEIEPNWARQCPGPTLVANAMRLPFRDNTFPAAVTSPTYGNRMADHHNAKDGSRRTSYFHCYGEDLHPDNTGLLHWGPEYRAKHVAIWHEVYRVVSRYFLLNISDHIRKFEVQPVTAWHKDTLEAIGFETVREVQVRTQRLQDGENAELRVEYETLFLFEKRGPAPMA